MISGYNTITPLIEFLASDRFGLIRILYLRTFGDKLVFLTLYFLKTLDCKSNFIITHKRSSRVLDFCERRTRYTGRLISILNGFWKLLFKTAVVASLSKNEYIEILGDALVLSPPPPANRKRRLCVGRADDAYARNLTSPVFYCLPRVFYL